MIDYPWIIDTVVRTKLYQKIIDLLDQVENTEFVNKALIFITNFYYYITEE